MWDDDIQPTNNMQTFEESGFPVGRGRGFSTMSNIKDSLPQIGGKSAFSTPAPANDSEWDDSGWNDDAGTTNNNNTNSWSNNNSNSNSYGRDNSNSYGSKSNRTCYKCQQEGHMSKNCPNTMPYNKSGFNKRGTECFKCKQEGHMSRDCPNSGSGGGGGSRACFKCGEEGHMSRECPNSGGGGGGGGGGSRACFKCGEEGHMSRDCTSSGGGGGGGGSSRACFKCGEEGHMSRDCTSSGGGKKSGCFKCGEDGHMSRECPNSGGEKRSNSCFKCGEEGHMSRECPSGGGEKRSNSCFKCGEEGHMSRDCTNSESSGKKSGCFKCGEEGHMSRECPNAESSGKKSGCFKCGEDGHMAKDCTNPDTRTGPDGKPRPPIYIPPEMSEDAADVFETVSAGINFSKYEKIAVDVSGDNAVPAFHDFKDSNLSQLLLKNIERSGYTKPTPVQKNAIPNIMNKRDIMACAETGSGKTAAFLLPMLNSMIQDSSLPNNSGNEVQEPIAVILAPTRELAIQIMAEARKFAYDSVVKAEVIYGGTSTGYQSSKIKRGIHILVATPGRLLDFVEKDKLSFANVKYFVLDEADRMLDMGFMPAVEKVVDHPTMPQKGVRQTLMFSATFAPEIQKLAAKFLDNYLFLTVGTVGGANADVEQSFYKLGQFEKRQKLMDILKESGTDRVLVFVEQKRTADFLASFTSQNDIPTTSIHGDRMQKEREEALRDFRSGKMPVLVATAVAARGLDIKDVRHVINYDLPQSIDEYVHRIGRTGRVGNLGKATSFYDPNVDQPLAALLKKILMDAQQNIPDWLHEEAANSSGPITYGGRGNFGGRDIRNNQSRRPNSSEAWENNAPASTDNNYSQSVDNDESWD